MLPLGKVSNLITAGCSQNHAAFNRYVLVSIYNLQGHGTGGLISSISIAYFYLLPMYLYSDIIISSYITCVDVLKVIQ